MVGYKMTICVAKINDDGTLELAADRQHTVNDIISHNDKIEHAHFECYDVTFCWAGYSFVKHSFLKALIKYEENDKRTNTMKNLSELDIFNILEIMYKDYSFSDCEEGANLDSCEMLIHVKYKIQKNFNDLNKLFIISGNSVLSITDDFVAIGSGCQVAYGANLANKKLSTKEIVDICCELCDGCSNG